MKRWKGAGKKWKLSEAQELGTLSIAKLPLQQKAELAQFYYRQFKLREAQFVNKMRIPFAYSKIVRDFETMATSDKLSSWQREITLDSPIVSAKGRYRTLAEPFASAENPNAALNNYIRRMQSFFSSESSTISGWDAIGKRQDYDLFGGEDIIVKSKRGKYDYIDENGVKHRYVPEVSLSDADRIKLWMIIDMAKDAGWLNRFGYSSSQLHREIASLFVNGTFNDFAVDDIDAAYNRVEELTKKKAQMEDKFPEFAPGISGNPTQQGEGGGNIKDVFGRSVRPDLLSGQHDSLLG